MNVEPYVSQSRLGNGVVVYHSGDDFSQPRVWNKEGDCNSSFLKICRVSLDVIAILVLLVSVVLTGAGLFTPAWQIADLFELGEYHEHGLWEDCVKGWTRTAGPKNEMICFYKDIFNTNLNFQPFYNQEGQTYYQSQLQQSQLQQQRLESWRLATLAFESISFGLGFLALFFGCCGMICKCPAVGWAVMTTLSALCGVIAVVNFGVHTTYPQNRFVLMTLTTAEMRLGRSFYMGLAGALIGVVAAILSVICVTFLCMPKHSKYHSGRQRRTEHARRYVTRVKDQIPGWPGWPKQTSI